MQCCHCLFIAILTHFADAVFVVSLSLTAFLRDVREDTRLRNVSCTTIMFVSFFVGCLLLAEGSSQTTGMIMLRRTTAETRFLGKLLNGLLRLNLGFDILTIGRFHSLTIV